MPKFVISFRFLQFLFDNIDKLRKCRIHEVSSVVVLVQLRSQTGCHTLLTKILVKIKQIQDQDQDLLLPRQERVVRGAKLDDEATIFLCFLPVPVIREIAALSLCAVPQVWIVTIKLARRLPVLYLTCRLRPILSHQLCASLRT